MGLSASEIEALKGVQTSMQSIRDEYARKRKQRDKPRPSVYLKTEQEN